ncbi:MAG: hypothetical protein IJ493_02950 [Clostridia bacterium]|nr:hypothetical protein [Clostridia bacterium]
MRPFEVSLPSGLVGCTIGGVPIKVISLSPTSIRLDADGEALNLRVYFYRDGGMCPLNVTAVRDGADYTVADPVYAAEVRRVTKLYTAYIHRRLDQPDADSWCDHELPLLPNGFDPDTDFGEVSLALNEPSGYRQPTLPVKGKIVRLYVGSRTCPTLLPTPEDWRRLAVLGYPMTLVLPPLSESMLDGVRPLLELAEEAEINDFGAAALCREYGVEPRLGLLLNRRRLDPRLPLKDGWPDFAPMLAENSVNDPLWREYLAELGITRYEFAAANYPLTVPEGGHSLHIGWIPTNVTAAFRESGVTRRYDGLPLIERQGGMFAFFVGGTQNFERVVIEP